MEEDQGKQGRRSTRLSISIPVIISGADAEGSQFIESARTLVVNKHGGKIAMAHRVDMGTEVLIENPALNVAGKACVVWLGEKDDADELSHVGLQMVEGENVWGVEFPPDDWISESPEESSAPPDPQPPLDLPVMAEAKVQPPVADEIMVRVLRELHDSVDAHTRLFQDRLKQLAHRLGLELEFDLRERAARAKEQEVGALNEEIKALKDVVKATRDEIGRLDAKIQKLQSSFDDDDWPDPSPLKETETRLNTLMSSTVEKMNRAAEAGLKEYRSLLSQENQNAAARSRTAAQTNPASPRGAAPKP